MLKWQPRDLKDTRPANMTLWSVPRQRGRGNIEAVTLKQSPFEDAPKNQGLLLWLCHTFDLRRAFKGQQEPQRKRNHSRSYVSAETNPPFSSAPRRRRRRRTSIGQAPSAERRRAEPQAAPLGQRLRAKRQGLWQNSGWPKLPTVPAEGASGAQGSAWV